MRASWRQSLLLAAIVACLACTLVYPIALTVGGAFRTDDGALTVRHVLSVFEDPSTRAGLVNAVAIASLAMGEMNSVPLKNDPRAEEWLVDSVAVMKALGVPLVLVAAMGETGAWGWLS